MSTLDIICLSSQDLQVPDSEYHPCSSPGIGVKAETRAPAKMAVARSEAQNIFLDFLMEKDFSLGQE